MLCRTLTAALSDSGPPCFSLAIVPDSFLPCPSQAPRTSSKGAQNGHANGFGAIVARAFLVVSFTLEHHLTFHLHSNPTFYSTIHQTCIVVIFTQGFSLCRSIESVFRSYGWNDIAIRTWTSSPRWNGLSIGAAGDHEPSRRSSTQAQ